jgi:hypothetical protein
MLTLALIKPDIKNQQYFSSTGDQTQGLVLKPDTKKCKLNLGLLRSSCLLGRQRSERYQFKVSLGK